MGRVDDFLTLFVPLQTLENNGTTDHVAPESRGLVACLDSHRSVDGESTMWPLHHRFDRLLGDLASNQQEAKHLGPEEPLHVLGIEVQEMSK